jgi:hypothetical protein
MKEEKRLQMTIFDLIRGTHVLDAEEVPRQKDRYRFEDVRLITCDNCDFNISDYGICPSCGTFIPLG